MATKSKYDPSQWYEDEQGFRFNRKSGEIILDGEGDSPVYSYNPAFEGGGKTTYNGQTYKGKIDPFLLDSITQEDYDAAYKTQDDRFTKAEEEYNKTPFQYGSAGANIGNIANNYGSNALIDAYGRARERIKETSFTGLESAATKHFKDLEAQKGTQPYASPEDAEKIQNNPNLSPAVKDAILAGYRQKMGLPEPEPVRATWSQEDLQRDPWRANAPFKASPAPQAPSAPVAPSAPAPVSQPSAPTAPQAQAPQGPQGLDWTSVYDQIQTYLKGLQPSSPAAVKGKPKEQIGSFQQFSPTIMNRSQSYRSSAPYSGK